MFRAMLASVSRSKDKLGERVDLSHLAIAPSVGSAATPDTQVSLETRDVSEAQVEAYDIERIKKKLIVLFLERFYVYMLSPHVPLENKVARGMAAMAQWEGTKRIIEWDKRVTDEKDLLAKADRLAQQIQQYAKKLPAEKVAKLQIEAAERMVKDLTEGEPN